MIVTQILVEGEAEAYTGSVSARIYTIART